MVVLLNLRVADALALLENLLPVLRRMAADELAERVDAVMSHDVPPCC